MITITFKPEFSGFTSAGHAGYAERGQDIVCSAVSALTQAVASHIEYKGFGTYHEKKDVLDVTTYDDAWITENELYHVRQLLEMLLMSLEALEHQYPNHIKVKGDEFYG